MRTLDRLKRTPSHPSPSLLRAPVWGFAGLVLLFVALSAPPGAAARDGGKARLVVAGLDRVPGEVAAGSGFLLRGVLRNKGTRPAKRAEIKLRLRGDGSEVRVGTRTLRRELRPGRRARLRIGARIPATTVPSTYRLSACVRGGGDHGSFRCRRAPGKLTVLPAPAYRPGARSLGDKLFPQIGNGGYDVGSYAIDLRYDPEANRFEAGTKTTITATATQGLSRFSFDFQDLPVGSVTVDGAAADFDQIDARPRLSEDPDVTQPMKLIVTPREPIDPGAEFSVEVNYSGRPVEVIDADGSSEGWIPACYPREPPRTCDGAFVVGEPIGSQGWFPSNNYATDKAGFQTRITVPATHTAFGVGELASNILNGDGTRTWTWIEDDPTAPYLTTATVGRFDLSVGSTIAPPDGHELAIYNGIDSSTDAATKISIGTRLDRAPGMIDFLGRRFGPYPFDSIGAVVDRAAGVGYALEVQTKAHFAGNFNSGDPGVGLPTLLHEEAHQWMGNAVSPASWNEIWFGEGWATFAEIYWQFETSQRDAPSPKKFFNLVYATPASEWKLAPAVLDDDPANLFEGFAVYERPAAMLQGYREIVGSGRFFELARGLLDRYSYRTVDYRQFVRLAVDVADLNRPRSRRLRAYFRQWLYREGRPSLTPKDF